LREEWGNDMAITAKSILKGVATTLNDLTSVQWTIDELVRYFNDGQREIVVLRPDAKLVQEEIALQAGASQALPAGAINLQDISHNTTGNLLMVSQITRTLLDAQDPNWRAAVAQTEVWNYCYNPERPLHFDVYPPAATGAKVWASYSAYPTGIAEPASGQTFEAVTGNMDIADTYANALTHYILFRAYTKDSESGSSDVGRANLYYSAFANLLGLDKKAMMEIVPTTRGADK
jgi:hypothetical protein